MLKKYKIEILFLLAGAVFGQMIFHPYAMFMYYLMDISHGKKLHLHWQDLLDKMVMTFNPVMLPMAFSFAFLGSVTGLLLGIVIARKKRLYVAEYENEKKKIAMETLRRLMVTLSHYLLNANMIIGGMARRCRKAEPSNEIRDAVKVIEEQARKIDAVISALRKVTRIKTADYTTHGHGLMLDITKEMDELLNKHSKTDPVWP